MIKDPILIVDDDDNLRDTMVDALAELPVEITAADSGQAAIDLIERRAFAVVVTDLVMKEKDGFDVLLQSKQRHPAGRKGRHPCTVPRRSEVKRRSSSCSTPARQSMRRT